MRRALAVVASVLAITAACSLYGANDDGEPAPDRESPDAAEASTESGPAADDAAVDAGFVDDAACASSRHFLCEDFAADGPLPPAAWTRVDSVAPAAIDLSTEKSSSPPRSLLVTYAADAGDASVGHAGLVKDVPSQLRKLTCAFSIYPEVLFAAETSYVFTMGLGGAPDTGVSAFWFTLIARSDSTGVRLLSYQGDGGPTAVEETDTFALTPELWTRVTLTIDLDAKTIRVAANSQTIILYSFTKTIAHVGGNLSFGISGASGETRFFIDDIVCD